MIRVCDAIMGSGKSSAAINYMNAHPEKRFIYITPYIEEANRITDACKHIKLYEPLRTGEFRGSKIAHTMSMIVEGKSIATTHQAFRLYSHDMADMIREKGYTLIIDEDVDTLDNIEESRGDVQLLIDAGCLIPREGQENVYRLGEREYYEGKHLDLFEAATARDIVRQPCQTKDGNRDVFFYWTITPDVMMAFEDVYILTYMFEGQSLYYMLKIHNIPFSYSGITRRDGMSFEFSDTERYVPEYADKLGSKIEIVDKGKLNRIGDGYFDLSASWFKKPTSDVTQLKNNVYNFFNHVCKVPAGERMWSTFKSAKMRVRGKGYTKGFVPFNVKAQNKYGNRTACAYCVNTFMDVGHKLYYRSNGIDADDDRYALSIMVQWIWRSAIRNGKDISLYIPSRRMRELLMNWITSVENGTDCPLLGAVVGKGVECA